MNYRLATFEDLPQLAEMRWDFRMEDGEEEAGVGKAEFVEVCVLFLRRGLESGSYVYWLAEEAGVIAAHVFVHRIALVPRPCRLDDRIGYLTNNYARPAHRGQGIGYRLLQTVEIWARAEDLELLITYPSEKAISLYERAGFRANNEVLELKLREY